MKYNLRILNNQLQIISSVLKATKKLISLLWIVDLSFFGLTNCTFFLKQVMKTFFLAAGRVGQSIKISILYIKTRKVALKFRVP